MKLNILSGKIAWFGKHSGYEPLTDYFPQDINVKIVKSDERIFGKIIGKGLNIFLKWKLVTPQDIYAELKFLINIGPKTVSHILYLEGHLQIIEKLGKKKKKLIGTVHLPISQWEEEGLKQLGKFEHAIILYKEEIPLFTKYIPLNKLRFIRLGISTDFFRPDIEKKIINNKVLIIGHFLRNFEMLFEVYKRICSDLSNEIEFHIIIPAMFRDIPELTQMAKSKKVFFHQNLSDQELLEQYQESNVLLIPMNDSGANTAIVQALAAGLPVITTDVGGIRSYGGGDIFPIVENDDVDGMVSLFTKYHQDAEFRNLIAENQRRFAVTYLDWKVIVQQHLDLYLSIYSN